MIQTAPARQAPATIRAIQRLLWSRSSFRYAPEEGPDVPEEPSFGSLKNG